MQALRRRARQRGLRVEQTAGGHYRISRPDGRFVITAATPSAPTTLANAIARIRRELGVDLRSESRPKTKIAKGGTLDV
jgi:hypothetical protein